MNDWREHMRGGLVVSCQPVDGGPLDDDEVVRRLCLAALAGGAVGLRLEGARRLARVRAATTATLIGIVKRDLADSPVRITPFVSDVEALATAGADIIAVDVTKRIRPTPISDLLAAIRAHGKIAMADASSLQDAQAAFALGFDIIGTTLAGYTGGDVPGPPDVALVRQLAAQGCTVMAEGRYNTPAEAAQAIAHGAWAVTVGSALTRLEVMTQWYVHAIQSSSAGAMSVPLVAIR
jgi:N-acylglucosamine-6-phosphate 2-epimerase